MARLLFIGRLRYCARIAMDAANSVYGAPWRLESIRPVARDGGRIAGRPPYRIDYINRFTMLP